MADYYVSSSIGHDTNGDGTRTFPYKTIAKVLTVVGANDNIYLFEDYFNEGNFLIDLIGSDIDIKGINNYAILDGISLVANQCIEFTTNSEIENLIIENFNIAIRGSACHNGLIKNVIIRNNNRAFFQANYIYTLEDCLIYDNNDTKTYNSSNYIDFNDDTSLSKKYNTFHNDLTIFSSTNCGNSFAYNIFSDSSISFPETNTLKYSLFYGNCQIYTGSAWVDVTSLTQLTTYGNGTFAGCEVMTNISGNVTDNGSGFIRVTSSTHGLSTGDYITIRVQDDYLHPRVQITKIDDNNFDVLDISYVSGSNTLEYNEPLFVNEFAGDFNVWQGSKATLMNSTDAYTPIGWGQAAIPVSVSQFTTNTNVTLTEQNGYTDATLTSTTSNGVLNGQDWEDFDAPTELSGILVNSEKDYANGRYLTDTSQISETIYNAGETLITGYYRVVTGAVTYATKIYDVDDVFYAVASTSFSTSASGQARLFNTGQQERSATIKIKFKRAGVESDEILLINGSTGNIINYQSNDPATNKITFGNGDVGSFDSGNAYPLKAIDSYKILEQTMQNGDRSAVI
ncbi:MAG: hypothetical protein GY849_02430 [Deltaproteobacteria bacterium]|nr:hypothetical protein [Deltaproteobacteria bacterium]